MARFRVTERDYAMGVYDGETMKDVLDAFARQAGYRDFEDLADIEGRFHFKLERMQPA